MRVAILTVSDSVAQGTRQDASGPALAERCLQLGWKVLTRQVVSDDAGQIRARLIEAADSGMIDLLLTTGGTGLGPRDVTPEATVAACARLIPGLPEMMRAVSREKNPRAVLSRAIAGIRGSVLILNLPGSPAGAVESLNAVANLLPHAVEVVHGARHD